MKTGLEIMRFNVWPSNFFHSFHRMLAARMLSADALTEDSS
jgi:hypothetical protein